VLAGAIAGSRERKIAHTSSHRFPLLAMFPGPPHRSVHVLTLAWHQAERMSESTVFTGTVQHGIGVAKLLLVWADAKPANAEVAATTRVE
jgi:hypothetical protein